jgi:hypothetical protein
MKASFNGTTLVRDYELRRRDKTPFEHAICLQTSW